MKLFAVLSFSLLSAGSAFFTERDLQLCPVPEGFSCTLESAPVKCGSTACEYDNQCIANAAGYSPGVCWPATCTAPAADVVCTSDSNPVMCGDGKCQYSNYCNAEAAGFPPSVCEALNCPAPTGVCEYLFDPYICLVEGTGLCRYDNDCEATSSPGVDIGRCLRTDEYVSNVLGSCPAVSSDIVCPLLYEPIQCAGCYYANECEASSAGYDTADHLTCQSAYCAAPSPDVACTMDYRPVACFDGCVYSNQCVANAAGYWDGGCVSYTCAVPDPNTQCSREYDPQICTSSSGEECTYDNLCIANSAGEFNCVAEQDPVNPNECPVPNPSTPCPREIDEKRCGANDCFYTNQCEATAAGFSEVECRNSRCPGSTADMNDCGDFSVDPLICGPYSCPYVSSCVANRAGWSPPVECTPQTCPQPSAGTVCTQEYKPTICAHSTLANGVPCPYSNTCIAAAAGYDTSAAGAQCYSPLIPTRGVSKEATPDANVTHTSDMEMDDEKDEEHDEDDHDHEHGDEDDEAKDDASSATVTSMIMALTSVMIGMTLM